MKYLALIAGAQAVKTHGSTTVAKVIELLDELKAKVGADVQAEEKMMAEFGEWCDDEQTTTSYAIKDGERVIKEQSALVEGNAAKVEQYSTEIGQLGPAIAGKETELKDATAIRKSENKDFLATEAELVEAEDMLRRAHGVLKRALTNPTPAGTSLVQSDASVKNIVTALSAIVDATWIESAKSRQLKAMLQSDDLSLSQQPQAASYNYESKS